MTLVDKAEEDSRTHDAAYCHSDWSEQSRRFFIQDEIECVCSKAMQSGFCSDKPGIAPPTQELDAEHHEKVLNAVIQYTAGRGPY